MPGTNAVTGKELTGLAHLRQSVRDILTTPLGSRVMRRDYGSRLLALVDAPLNDGVLVEIYAAAAEALGRWEPRLRLRRVKAHRTDSGRVMIDLEGEYLPDGAPIRLEGLML